MIPVALYTRDGNRWQLDDPEATIEHVVEQLQKPKPPAWLPVLGPLEGSTSPARMQAGWIRTHHVLGVFPQRTQP